MYFTDRGIEELAARRGQEQVSLEWLSEQLRTFVDLNPQFEVATERLATFLARLDDEEDGAEVFGDFDAARTADADGEDFEDDADRGAESAHEIGSDVEPEPTADAGAAAAVGDEIANSAQNEQDSVPADTDGRATGAPVETVEGER